MNDKMIFVEIISQNFVEIRNNFKSGLRKLGYEYDEDILADTFIKCNSTLNDKKLTKKEAIKYFWTAYVNTLKNVKLRNKKITEFPENFDMINDEYNDDVDKLYDTVMEILYNNFDENDVNIWIQYKFNKTTFNEILKLYDSDKNLQYIFKKIGKFLKNNIYNDKNIVKILDDIRTT